MEKEAKVTRSHIQTHSFSCKFVTCKFALLLPSVNAFSRRREGRGGEREEEGSK